MNKSVASRNRLFASVHVPQVLLRQIGWTTGGYGFTQVVRFATNLTLTRLLAPELFGIMVLLTSLRIGIELFSDLGIGQSLIANKNTRDETFYNTAWTMQVIRGLLLSGLVLLGLPALRAIYDAEALQGVLPVLSVFLIVTGTHSIALTVATKELRTKRIAVYDTVCALAQAGLVIGAVLVSPTIIGLIVGQILGAIFTAAASYFVLPDVRCRFVLNRSAAFELLTFGKWIFLSSIVFFLSSYIDRLVLGKYVTLALLGVYGVARALGDVFAQFGTRLANIIIFPKVAAAEERGLELRNRIRKRRLQFLAPILLGIAALIALAEPLIAFLYDPRYILAAEVLPWVGIAAWLAIVNTLNDSVALGVGKPHLSMLGNAAKLIALIVLLPLGVIEAGIVGAAAATAAAEIARYAVLVAGLLRERLSFLRQDIVSTGALLLFALSLYELSRFLAPDRFSFTPFQDWTV